MKTVSKLAISAIFLTALASPTVQANPLLIPMVGSKVVQEVGKQIGKEVLRDIGEEIADQAIEQCRHHPKSCQAVAYGAAGVAATALVAPLAPVLAVGGLTYWLFSGE